MDYKEFAGKIRAKHPGAYDDMDDQSLAKAIVTKYPQYSDVTFEAPKSSVRGDIGAAFGRTVGLLNPVLSPLGAKAGRALAEDPKGAAAQALEFAPAAGAVALPAAASTVSGPGAIALAGAGAAAGEGVRQIGRKALGFDPVTQKKVPIPFTDINVPDIPGIPKAASNIIVEGAMGAAGEGAAQSVKAMLPLVSSVGKTANKYAGDMARRALGFTKMHLSSTKSAFEAARKTALANKAAREMLEMGAISKIGDAEKTAVNAMNILRANRSQMETVMAVVDEAGIKADPSDIGVSIIETIKPKFANQNTAVEQILDDLDKVGQGPLSVKNLDELRQRWGDIGFSRKMAGTEEAKIYRKAWRLIDDKLTETIRKAPTGEALASMYRSAKSTASSATNALKGLSNKIAQDAGNNVFGLPEYGLAAGQLASGNVSEALATLGVVKTLRGRGAAITANAAQAVGNIAEAGAKGVPPEAVRMSVQGLRGAEAFSRKEKEEGSYSGNGIQSLLAPSATSASAEPLPRMTGAAQPLSSDAGAYKAGLEAFLGGDTKTAKQEWQKALRLNPKNRAARNGLERLAAKDGKDPDAYKLK